MPRRYKSEDNVRVEREQGVVLNGTVIERLEGDLYRVAIAGQGPRVVEGKQLSPHPDMQNAKPGDYFPPDTPET